MTSAGALLYSVICPILSCLSVLQVNGNAVDNNWMTLQRTDVYQGFFRRVRSEPELRVSGNESLGTDVFGCFEWGSGKKEP